MDERRRDCGERRPKFGNRFLTDARNVFEHNAWDNIIWDEEQEVNALKKTKEQATHLVSLEKQVEYDEKANQFWDRFYLQHQDRFFKDRNWLFTEFPELASVKCCQENSPSRDPSEDSLGNIGLREGDNFSLEKAEKFSTGKASFQILEVGCGAGNTVFPVLKTNNDPHLMVYCCDFSPKAVSMVMEHPDFEKKRCFPFVCDVTEDSRSIPFPENSLDIVILIFFLSSITPSKVQGTINRLSQYLKPGGLFLFRDYGRYDMAQLRFKKGHCLSENFYVRQDGTRAYFFTQDELREIFTQEGLQEEQNMIDRRLQVNRGKQLKMYRVWIQCKYRKPVSSSSGT